VNRAHQRRSVQTRLGQAVPCAASDDVGHSLLISIFGQQNERNQAAVMKQVRHKPDRLVVPGIMFE
jgi:hypothetical protein